MHRSRIPRARFIHSEDSPQGRIATCPVTISSVLQAALFGRSFLCVNLSSATTSVRPALAVINDLCTSVIRNLHLVNNLQHIDVSMPITYEE